MAKALIESYIDQLRISLGSIKVPIDESCLETLFNARDYSGMVCFVKDIMRLQTQIRLGLVTKGGPPSPAWVVIPEPMPLYGSSEFRATVMTMYLRKAFLLEGTLEQIVHAISHELSHIILDSIGHSLKREEKAVDLTAMLLGFRDFYVTGCQTVKFLKKEVLHNGSEIRTDTVETIGYLTPEEVRYAAWYMTFR